VYSLQGSNGCTSIEYYFYRKYLHMHDLRKSKTLKRFKKMKQLVHLNNEEHGPEPTDDKTYSTKQDRFYYIL
jgi:hypothetical protein